MIHDYADLPLRVFVIWEPVIASDTGPPNRTALARLPDRRATHYWDPAKSLATLAGPVLKASPVKVIGKESLVRGDIVWDYVSVYPRGVKWSDAFPEPKFMGAPVISAERALREALASEPR